MQNREGSSIFRYYEIGHKVSTYTEKKYVLAHGCKEKDKVLSYHELEALNPCLVHTTERLPLTPAEKKLCMGLLKKNQFNLRIQHCDGVLPRLATLNFKSQ